MANYCDYDNVALLLGFDEGFTATSKPTATQVTTVCTQITGMIDSAFLFIGVSSQPTGTAILQQLEHIASFGAAGTVGMNYGQNFDNVTSSQADWYYSKFEDFLKDINDNPGKWLKMLGQSEGSNISNQVIDDTITEDDQNDLLQDDEVEL